ncbi:MAG: hypothetical protein JSW71_00575 [Gemmatimonadota bacterium]|nr:MAG: hypothetical protein JSW71_00575 [Gemmatimonadota bacterium]
MTEAASTEGQTKSAGWLVLRVFDEPVQVFTELAARPRALLPIILLVVVTGVFAFGTPADVLRQQARDRVEAFRERAQLTDEQVQEQIEDAASSSSRALIFGGGSAAGLIVLAIVSLVLMLIFGATGPEPIKFKTEFAVLAHANVVSLAGMLLMVILMAFAGIDNPQLSLGFLFSEETSPFLYRFANQITLFGTWHMLLVALGNKILSKAKGLGGPLLIVGGLWLLVKLVVAAVGGLGFLG